MPAGVNEIVLCDELGALLEGMSSNFFVVLKDDTLVTADAGVLVRPQAPVVPCPCPVPPAATRVRTLKRERH